jgi:hypothetical protein
MTRGRPIASGRVGIGLHLPHVSEIAADSGPAFGSRHQRAFITARVPGPNRNRAMTCGSG